MSPSVVGQRFVSEAEPELGLGRVEGVEKRSLLLRFPAGDAVRRYASGSAPLRRVAFRVGDEIEDLRGRRLRVEKVVERDGLLIYANGSRRVSESDLADERARSRAEKHARETVAGSLEEAHERLGAEVRRLRSLAEVNDHVAPKEVSVADARRKRIEKAIKDAKVRLDSLRLVFLGLDPSRA